MMIFFGKLRARYILLAFSVILLLASVAIAQESTPDLKSIKIKNFRSNG
jgi:hypothetical protein